MCLTELAKNDKRWREIAVRITGNKNDADDLVQEMYLRNFRNDKGKTWNEYYVTATMRSIFLNEKTKIFKEIPKEVIYPQRITEQFEPNDYEKNLLDKAKKLPYNQRELLELSYDYSLREIQEHFKVNYLYTYRTTKKARETLLNGDLTKYNNKRLKYKIMAKKDTAYYESLDKRSKEYREYKASKKSIGLGDTLEKFFVATGIKTFVEKVVGSDCGCEERKKKLNELFKYNEKPKCLDAQEIEEYQQFINTRNMRLTGKGKATGKLSAQDITFLCEFYSEVFGRKLWIPNCSSCRGTSLTLIKMIYKCDAVFYNNI